MDVNVYALERIARERLTEFRDHSARLALLRAAHPARTRVSRVVGAALIRVGHWLARGDTVRTRNAGVRVAR